MKKLYTYDIFLYGQQIGREFFIVKHSPLKVKKALISKAKYNENIEVKLVKQEGGG